MLASKIFLQPVTAAGFMLSESLYKAAVATHVRVCVCVLVVQ